MSLLNSAVRPALGSVIQDAVNGGRGEQQTPIDSASLELLFVFDVYKTRDRFEPATLALDFAANQYAELE